MKAFFVRWRSARQFREYELFASETIGACLFAALQASGGLAVWQAGTLWQCPGCGDRTLRTEEFLEGLRRAEAYLQTVGRAGAPCNAPPDPVRTAALQWLREIAVTLFGCERDRVYIKDACGPCRFAGETYISRI
ncbi:MAG: hypothetical protein RMJ43_12420 [Chloroherpetonaceae bacterium]|nr:hypothetical protein [Chthonomonadaceae bacterium]MDW8208633.1 hypothetical protein [Chloroherpetonaceae bacterium]